MNDRARLQGKWFADLIAPMPKPVYIRGVHYSILSQPLPAGITITINPDKPNEIVYTTYENTKKHYDWLVQVAADARWLGLVDFDHIRDERTAEPLAIRLH